MEECVQAIASYPSGVAVALPLHGWCLYSWDGHQWHHTHVNDAPHDNTEFFRMIARYNNAVTRTGKFTINVQV